MNDHRSPMYAVVVPAAQSIISGVLLGLLVGMLSSFEPNMPSLKISAVVMLVVTTIAWFWLRSAWNSQLERLLNIDLNRDGLIGAVPPKNAETIEVPYVPPPVAEVLRVRLETETGEDWFEIETNKGRFIEVCRLAASGIPITYSSMSGPGRMFTRGEFTNFRDAVLKEGLARLSAGGELEWTAKGMAVIRGVSRQAREAA